MCAVDALGMSAMLHRPVTVHSTEPDTRTPIMVILDNTRSTCSPDTTVVVVGSTRSPVACAPSANGGPDGDAPAHRGVTADVGCGMINFFTHPDRAAGWLAAHPAVIGEVLADERAPRLGVCLFGCLLDSQPT
jgi:hypothetical protein